MTYTIYHNSNCSKSREALQILKSKVSDIRVIEYLKNLPDEEEVKDIIIKLNINPKELIRFKDDGAKKLQL